jgi:hypothetical protein
LKESVANQVYAVLRKRKTQNGHEWSDANAQAHQQEYSIVLWDKPDTFGKWLLPEIIKRWKWRPEPCELEAVYPEFLGFNMDSAAMFAEIMEARDKHGLYALPSPDYPGLMIEGAPPELTAKPGLEAVLRRMGGWGEVCGDDARQALQKRFEWAYKGVLETARTNPAILSPPAVKQLELGTKLLTYNQEQGE